MMANNEDLITFVRQALERGGAREDIRSALTEAQWAPDDVDRALAAFTDTEWGPAPKPRPSVSAREAFQYVILFGSLYAAAWGLGQLVYQLIDTAFPDPTWSPYRFELIPELIRWSIAALVVAAPVFVYSSRTTSRAVEQFPAMRTSPIRHWLTYLTLAVAAGILVGDAIALIHKVLSGDLTTRFILKALTLGGIAGTVFYFYLRDLRRDEHGAASGGWPGTRILQVALGVSAVAVVAGVVVAGSPSRARLDVFDRVRSDHMSQIVVAIDGFWNRNDRLPADLNELAADPRTRVIIVDPATSVPYEFEATAERSYRMCATFDRASREIEGAGQTFRQHPAGRHCFDVDVSIPR